MRHMFEMYITAGENWMESSNMVNIRNSSRGQKKGRYVWVTWQALADKFLAFTLATQALTVHM